MKVLPELIHSEKKVVQYVLHSVGENNKVMATDIQQLVALIQELTQQ